jgi:hypothetical protein
MRYIFTLVVLLALTVYSAPYLIKDQVLIWLKHQGVQNPHLKSISINWLTGTVIIDRLKAENINASPKLSPLDISSVTLSINYAKLFDQQILIEEFTIDGLNSGFSEINQQQYLGPINLTTLMSDDSQKPQASKDKPSQWQVGINTFELSNITFAADIPDYQYTLSIEQAALNNLHQWQPSVLSQFSLKGKIDQSPISLQAKAAPFTLSQQSTFDIKFDQLDLTKLGAGFAPQLSGIASADLSATVIINGSSDDLSATLTHQGKINLPALGWQQGQQKIAVSDFNWDGKGSVNLQKAKLADAQLDGKITAKQLLIDEKEKLNLELADFSWQLDSEVKAAQVTATDKNNKEIEKQLLKLSSSDDISIKSLNIKQPGTAVKLTNLSVNSSKSSKQPLSITLEDNQPVSLVLPYQIALNKLVLNQGKQSINVGSLTLSQTKSLEVTLQNNAPVTIKGTPKIMLTNVGISTGEQQIKMNALNTQGPISLASKRNKDSKNKNALWHLSTDNTLSIAGLKANVVKPFTISSASINSKASIKNQPLNKLSIANLNLSLSKLNVSNDKAGMRIASVESLKVNNAQLSETNVKVASIAASQLTLASQKGNSPLTQVSSLKINNLSLANQSQLSVSAINLVNTKSRLFIDQNGNLPLLEDLTQALATNASGANNNAANSSATKSKSSSKAFQYNIGKLNLTGDNLIEIEDKSVDPWFKSQINIQQLNVSAINSNSAQPSPVTLKAMINDQASLNLDAQLKLLNPEKYANWKLSLEGLSMPEISPYAGKFSGYFLENGKLSLKGEGKIENNKINGENKITIEQLAVRSAESAATSKTNSSLNMPLDVAISVLENDEGNIKLTVPVSGSLDDPNFGYSSILEIIAKKGLKKAAFGILSKALQPYGALITLATTAIDAKNSGTFINLAPVSFSAGSAKIDKKMQGYLVKIAKMMKQRKKLKLKICGTGVQQDHTSISLDMVAINAKRDKPLPSKALDKAILNTLQSLADQRGKIVQKALLKQKVDKKRLFTCFAKTNLKNAKLKPSVSLGL